MHLFTVRFSLHREGTPFSVAPCAMAVIAAVEADNTDVAVRLAADQLRAMLRSGFEFTVFDVRPYSPNAPVFVRGRWEDVTE